jgi:NTP pyrophosphatase (non-canonical NTP hydrolase)
MKDVEKEVLLITMEECSEVAQAISKVLRFGLDTVYKGESNRGHLEEELGDLRAMIKLLVDFNLVDEQEVQAASVRKLKKLRNWSTVFSNEII